MTNEEHQRVTARTVRWSAGRANSDVHEMCHGPRGYFQVKGTGMLMWMPLTFKRTCKLIPHRGTKDWERGWFERPLTFPLSLMISFFVKLKKKNKNKNKKTQKNAEGGIYPSRTRVKCGCCPGLVWPWKCTKTEEQIIALKVLTLTVVLNPMWQVTVHGLCTCLVKTVGLPSTKWDQNLPFTSLNEQVSFVQETFGYEWE